ncbi:aspartate semialdehyde dehydrogenase [Desulfonispora thiosulfatigenes DSM 11270]|uniref:Aspartate-semialdehyde dehydrogenase n=1 Tax=Desulfonispora thiosulfatigenes DSM 11270 TaxID=656914 RepID=A0A1W1VMC3_DESTI|nr:aspartate-semialdehyde dehydrogenase [Desulfonispora thiosulfatigenes]SMB94529.1 aspartate semialdehyde dehydrogenase [Desulfonispora thiosulfatigenes DSM 11270]
MKKVNIAIVGATGAVGQEILKVMTERNFPYKSLKLLASKRSAGQKITYNGEVYEVEETTEKSFDDVDIALFAGGPASRAYGRIAQSKGVIVIDNSSTFRLEPDVPLVVPEVNPEALKDHKGLIASPNCSTIIMAVALNPIYRFSKINRVIVSTYQAVSGAGREGIDELSIQSKQVLDGSPIKPDKFAHQIAFNLIPHIDSWVEENYTKEEMKMVYETHKIFDDKEMAITATTVRVPVFRSHSESVYIETEENIPVEKVKELLSSSKGIVVKDEPQENSYPMPADTSDTDDIYVGRIRKDLYIKNGLNLWIAGDQIRKGAATNTVQIAEELLKNNLV